MNSLTIFTCVTGEPDSLLATEESIRPWLSDNIKWYIKFSEKTEDLFVKKYAQEYVTIHQESDLSLYDGLNQVLKLATGDFYMVLGAGDTLLPQGMKALCQILNNDTLDLPSYHGPILMSSSNMAWIPQPTLLREGMKCPHPTSLLRIKNSLAINGFDLKYKIASDYDHMCRYANTFGNGSSLEIPPFVSFMGGGMSDAHELEGFLECQLIRKRIWDVPDIRVHSDLLNQSGNFITNIIRNQFQ